MLPTLIYTQTAPFAPKRFFVVSGVPQGATRGGHAHRALHELLVCVTGSLKVTATDGHTEQTFTLDSPKVSLHLPPMVWATQHDHSPDAVLLVLASLPYNPDDYIKSLERFKDLVFARDHF
jgi:dTDP-4-dehydrorhamnose 3,5-epimerase-like enzyme